MDPKPTNHAGNQKSDRHNEPDNIGQQFMAGFIRESDTGPKG